MLHGGNKRAGVQMGRAWFGGLYFPMARECVSDMCDRWASGVESGGRSRL